MPFAAPPSAIAVALMLPASIAMAADIHVPADQPSIQAGIDAAGPDDRVLVAPGTYFEHIDYHGRSVPVIGTGGPSVTTIDGSGTDRVVVFQSGETDLATLQGFTIQGGFVRGANPFTGAGGGIYIAHGSPTIADDVVRRNTACYGGGIAVMNDSHPWIRRNVVEHNATPPASCEFVAYGAGIYLQDDAATTHVENNRIAHNVGSYGGGMAVLSMLPARPLLMRNTIEANAGDVGGGLYMAAQRGRVFDSLIVRNTARTGAGVYVWGDSPSYSPILMFDTIADNGAAEGIQADADLAIVQWDGARIEVVNTIVRTSTSKHTVRCNGFAHFRHDDIHATNGVRDSGCRIDVHHTQQVDPRFVGGDGTHAYELVQTSPLIDAGTDYYPDQIRRDLGGNLRGIGLAPDIGAFEYAGDRQR